MLLCVEAHSVSSTFGVFSLDLSFSAISRVIKRLLELTQVSLDHQCPVFVDVDCGHDCLHVVRVFYLHFPSITDALVFSQRGSGKSRLCAMSLGGQSKR